MDILKTAKLTDGLLVVVRQNYCDTIALNAAIRQFEFVDAKVLGIVFNCVVEDEGRYGYRYYRKYYKRYYKKYGGNYASTAHKNAKAGAPKETK